MNPLPAQIESYAGKYTPLKEQGAKLLAALSTSMVNAKMTSMFAMTSFNDIEIKFQFLGFEFITVLEILPTNYSLNSEGQLTIYWLKGKDKEEVEIVSFCFDKIGNVNRMYTVNEFADFYLVEFLKNIKTTILVPENKVRIS